MFLNNLVAGFNYFYIFAMLPEAFVPLSYYFVYSMFFLRIIILLFFVISECNAVTYYAGVCPGPITWNDWATSPFWTGTGATGTHLTAQPANGSLLIIPAGCTVTIANTINSTSNYTMQVDGTLRFQTGKKLNMGAGSSIYVSSTGNLDAGTGGGSANLITIGSSPGVDVWSSGVGDVSGPFILNSSCSMTSSGPPAVYSPAGCGTTLLPIELLEFTGTCIAKGVQLNWITASELNNDYYLIEKSYNATNWQLISKVAGNGTTSSLKKYFYTDPINTNQLTYYRLSQVDYDGTKETFNPIDINCESNSIDQMVFFPNPSFTELNIIFNVKNASSNNTIKLLDQYGQIALEKNIELYSGMNNFNFELNVAPGTYIIMYISDNRVLDTQKIIIIK